MNPDDIRLKNLEKIFKYERLSREIDNCNDLDQLKNISKSFAKLYLKQEETLLSLMKNNEK